MKEVRIYTPQGNLREGVIVTESKRYRFSNSDKKRRKICRRNVYSGCGQNGRIRQLKPE